MQAAIRGLPLGIKNYADWLLEGCSEYCGIPALPPTARQSAKTAIRGWEIGSDHCDSPSSKKNKKACARYAVSDLRTSIGRH